MQNLGPAIYILILASVILFAMTLERLWTYSRLPRRRSAERCLIIFENHIQNQAWISAENSIEEKETSPLIRHMEQSILESRHYAADIRAQYLSATLTHLRHRLQDALIWLHLIAMIAPMLGLLGTIWGISHSFQNFTDLSQTQTLTPIIHYLSSALWATAIGIALSVISLILYYSFRRWSDAYLQQWEAWMNKMYCLGSRERNAEE